MKNTFTRAGAMVLPQESNIKPLVLGGLAILGLLVAAYVYFVGKIVFDVIARREAEKTIHFTQSSVSQLQVAYFNQSRGLTMADAVEVGLAESHRTLYANRTTTSTVGMVVR